MLPPSVREHVNCFDKDYTRSLRRWQDCIIDAICAWSKDKKIIQFLSVEGWKEDTCRASGKFCDDFPNTLVYHVDGTVLPVYASSCIRISKAMYNSKHDTQAWQVFVLCSQTGRIVYLSTIEGGKCHDKTHWEKDNVTKLLYEAYRDDDAYEKGKFISEEIDEQGVTTQVTYQCMIGGDKAYRDTCLPEGWKLKITKTGENHDIRGEQDAHDNGIPFYAQLAGKKRKNKQCEAEGSNGAKKRSKMSVARESRAEELGVPVASIEDSQTFDPTIACYRSVVERVMMALKRWRVLVTNYHLTMQRVEDIVQAVASLTNYQLEHDCETNW